MSKKITLDDLKNRLAAKNYKMTPQRQTVLQLFLEHPESHLSAEDVYDLLRDKKMEIGLATVYRSLELLSKLGMLEQMDFGDGCNRYEIAANNPHEHHHHHLICLECGKVMEFSDDLLDSLEQDIEKKSGFKVVNHQVKFLGYCKECRGN